MTVGVAATNNNVIIVTEKKSNRIRFEPGAGVVAGEAGAAAATADASAVGRTHTVCFVALSM